VRCTHCIAVYVTLALSYGAVWPGTRKPDWDRRGGVATGRVFGRKPRWRSKRLCLCAKAVGPIDGSAQAARNSPTIALEQIAPRGSATGCWRSVGRAVSRRPMPPRRSAGVRNRSLAIVQFGAAQPSLRHPNPYGFVFRAARELGHELAFGGKSLELFGRIHGLALPVLFACLNSTTRAVSKSSKFADQVRRNVG